MEEVLEDVRRGFVSVERARRDYGVVLAVDGSVDAPATARLRGDLGRQRVAAEFGHGPGRMAFEAVWNLERYDVLTRLLAAAPITWRFFIKHRVFAALKGQVAPAGAGGADVVRAYSALAETFADLPPAPAALLAEYAAAAE
jgi:N-methylhydantoinase B